jgi:hypothetical protein
LPRGWAATQGRPYTIKKRLYQRCLANAWLAHDKNELPLAVPRFL